MKIDEKTSVPLFAVACATPFLIGGILWLTSIDAKASSASEEAKAMRQHYVKIIRSLARIETKLKIEPKEDE